MTDRAAGSLHSLPRSVRYCKLFLSGTVILFLPKPDLIPGAASSLILQRGIVPLSGIDIGVAKHIGHQIDVACLPVQVGAIGAAQLVRVMGFNGATVRAYFLTRFSTLRTAMRLRCRERKRASSFPGTASIIRARPDSLPVHRELHR